MPINSFRDHASIDDVRHLLPVITPYTLPVGTAGINLYDVAVAQLKQDAPHVIGSGLRETRALCYYIAVLMAQQSARADGVTSEHLGDWSASYSADGSAPGSTWYQQYLAVITDAPRRSVLIARGMVSTIPDVALDRNYGIDATNNGGTNLW